MSRRNSFFKSSNPFMKEEAYQANQPLDSEMVVSYNDRMTVSGAVNKTFILAGILLFTTLIGYSMPSPLFIWGGAIAGLAMVIWAAFQPHRSPYLAPAYAAFEGLFVGGISYMYAGIAGTTGIIFNAVSLTIALLFMMLFLYKSGLIKVTQKFRSGVMMATGAVLLVYVMSWILGMFGIDIPYLHQGGMIGIGISVVIIGIACLNLLLDFDNFDKGERYGAAKYMEWFSAMGLIVTLVWLYVEILRLLTILSGED